MKIDIDINVPNATEEEVQEAVSRLLNSGDIADMVKDIRVENKTREASRIAHRELMSQFTDENKVAERDITFPLNKTPSHVTMHRLSDGSLYIVTGESALKASEELLERWKKTSANT